MASDHVEAFLHGDATPPPAGFAQMIDALRVLQDQITAAAPPADVVAHVTRSLDHLASALRPYGVDESRQLVGRLLDLPGRGQTMAPVVHIDVAEAHRIEGRVTFGRNYLGRNAAAHGGAITLLFDEVLGRLALANNRSVARTAYLNVDFRSVTPIGQELRVEGWFTHEQGRKRYLHATLHAEDRLCAEARGLFVQLRPGAP